VRSRRPKVVSPGNFWSRACQEAVQMAQVYQQLAGMFGDEDST